ncbi:cob(I)yrinic acid a,c-diamide adenosyltransferase [Roseburia hominis]
MKEKGLLHIYCGDGKGKTTAATGLAIRAAGSGLTVLFARFLKNENSGELSILDRIPEIEVIHLEKSFGFFRTLNVAEQEECIRVYRKLWENVVQKIQSGGYDMLVLDEFAAAYSYGMIGQAEALTFFKQRPENLEVVLTGRNPAPELIEIADYVSEVQKRKHPFDQGIRARRGIEF